MTKYVLTPLLKRFWSKVKKGSGCWEWTGGKTSHGYGMIGKGRTVDGLVYAHRLSYELHFGKIPEGKLVLHRCNNFACVNPEHLYIGTHSDNIKQAYDDGLRCKGCRGVRFKKCTVCGKDVNSFPDFRVRTMPAQVYETTREWKEVNGEPVQSVPERKRQP